MALKSILLIFLLTVVVNGQRNKDCRKQIQQFQECKSKIMVTPEQTKIYNATEAMYTECLKNHSCLTSHDELPHDIHWQIRQCNRDVRENVREKVIKCVRQRGFFDFEMPEKYDYTYGPFSWESAPFTHVPIVDMCKDGDLKGAINCYMDVANRTRRDTADLQIMYDGACQRRSQCFKLLDGVCRMKLESFSELTCECGYDVHDLYGGKRLISQVPSCSGFLDETKFNYTHPDTSRQSCQLKDVKSRDAWYKMCEMGYENFEKSRMQSTSTMSTTTVVTESPEYIEDK